MSIGPHLPSPSRPQEWLDVVGERDSGCGHSPCWTDPQVATRSRQRKQRGSRHTPPLDGFFSGSRDLSLRARRCRADSPGGPSPSRGPRRTPSPSRGPVRAGVSPSRGVRRTPSPSLGPRRTASPSRGRSRSPSARERLELFHVTAQLDDFPLQLQHHSVERGFAIRLGSELAKASPSLRAPSRDLVALRTGRSPSRGPRSRFARRVRLLGATVSFARRTIAFPGARSPSRLARSPSRGARSPSAADDHRGHPHGPRDDHLRVRRRRKRVGGRSSMAQTTQTASGVAIAIRPTNHQRPICGGRR